MNEELDIIEQFTLFGQATGHTVNEWLTMWSAGEIDKEVARNAAMQRAALWLDRLPK